MRNVRAFERSTQAALETRFRAADTDGTGTLSREDLRRALADADGTDDARLATLFERADTNESGGVDLDECRDRAYSGTKKQTDA